MGADEMDHESIAVPSFIYEGAEEDSALDFLDDACRAALGAIGGRSAERKRLTVVRLVLARMNGVQVREVFADHQTGSASTWYEVWQYEPEVRTAYALLLKRAFLWREQETLNVEIRVSSKRRRVLALASMDAIKSLRAVATDPEAPLKYRIEACLVLLTVVDEVFAGRIALAKHGKPLPVPGEGFDEFIGKELERLTVEYEDETGAL